MGVHGMTLFGDRDGLYASHLPVGRFLAKQTDSRPDFDHIVALDSAAAAPVVLPKPGLDNPEPALTKLAPVRGTVHFETGDLR